MRKKSVSIIGTGNIGSDLLVKFLRNEKFKIHSFVGQRENSKGIQFCREKYPKITTSTKSIDFISENKEDIDIVVDCTSAIQHIKFNKLYEHCNFKVIDMTPSKIGILTVPNLLSQKKLNVHKNFNLISCGGQTSIPVAHAISEYVKEISYLEVVSSISSKSAGPATRKNLDQYIETTELGLSAYTGISKEKIKVILIVNPAIPEIDMQTSIYFKTDNKVDINILSKKIQNVISDVNEYVPGYRLVVPLTHVGDKHVLSIKVSGCGDYLPSYAGNLDIINCACIDLAEKI